MAVEQALRSGVSNTPCCCSRFRRVPSRPRGGIEHVEIVASRPLLVQIDLPVFPFRHSSHLLPDARPSEVPAWISFWWLRSASLAATRGEHHRRAELPLRCSFGTAYAVACAHHQCASLVTRRNITVQCSVVPVVSPALLQHFWGMQKQSGPYRYCGGPAVSSRSRHCGRPRSFSDLLAKRVAGFFLGSAIFFARRLHTQEVRVATSNMCAKPSSTAPRLALRA
jgi:hypothetical protein